MRSAKTCVRLLNKGGGTTHFYASDPVGVCGGATLKTFMFPDSGFCPAPFPYGSSSHWKGSVEGGGLPVTGMGSGQRWEGCVFQSLEGVWAGRGWGFVLSSHGNSGRITQNNSKTLDSAIRTIRNPPSKNRLLNQCLQMVGSLYKPIQMFQDASTSYTRKN